MHEHNNFTVKAKCINDSTARHSLDKQEETAVAFIF